MFLKITKITNPVGSYEKPRHVLYNKYPHAKRGRPEIGTQDGDLGHCGTDKNEEFCPWYRRDDLSLAGGNQPGISACDRGCLEEHSNQHYNLARLGASGLVSYQLLPGTTHGGLSNH